MNFFFFNQKTAYEMRISDWSSDVCSSDLVMLPPLRDRRSDIAALAGHFVEAGRHAGLPDRQFAPAAMQRLERHDWPGNVRELGNVVQRQIGRASCRERVCQYV